MKKQKVVRTKIKAGVCLRENDSYENLEKLLNEGYRVVMCMAIGSELEYIVEKDYSENITVVNTGIESAINEIQIKDICNAIEKELENRIGTKCEVMIR